MYELPKKVKRIEADVDGLIANKLWKIYPGRNWALEVKIKGRRLKDHQAIALKQVENGTFKPLKLKDHGSRNPFDYVCLGDADAIVCVVDGKKVTCDVNDGVITHRFTI